VLKLTTDSGTGRARTDNALPNIARRAGDRRVAGGPSGADAALALGTYRRIRRLQATMSTQEDVPDSLGRVAPRIRPTRRRSLSEEIVDQLLELIANGDAPEQALPTERVLCDRLEVSRAALREALSALAHLGVLETRGKVKYGSLVAARSQLIARESPALKHAQLIDDPMEVRRIVEPAMAALAAERGDATQLADVRMRLDRMEEAARRGERTVDHDSSFHTAIARATGNETLVQVVRALADAISTSRDLSLRAPEAVESALDAHRAIVEALESHDPGAARRAMERHLDSVEESIRALLPPSRRDAVDGSAD